MQREEGEDRINTLFVTRRRVVDGLLVEEGLRVGGGWCWWWKVHVRGAVGGACHGGGGVAAMVVVHPPSN